MLTEGAERERKGVWWKEKGASGLQVDGERM